MLKQLRKTFVLIYVVFALMCPLALADTTTLPNTAPNNTGVIQNDVRVNDLDIEPINVQNVTEDVIPDSHKQSKKVMAFFLKTMMGVAISAVLLYIVLLFIKKFYQSALVDEEDEYESLDLSTPNNKQDALKSFLNRSIK